MESNLTSMLSLYIRRSAFLYVHSILPSLHVVSLTTFDQKNVVWYVLELDPGLTHAEISVLSPALFFFFVLLLYRKFWRSGFYSEVLHCVILMPELLKHH